MICIVGAARSGTTLLAEQLLSHDKRFAYAAEPNYIWRYGSAYAESDVRGRFCATDKVKKSIRDWFCDFANQSGTQYILDKTPANSLRLPFINEIFPNAVFIHFVRDGHQVVRSAMDEWCGQGKEANDSIEFRQQNSYSRIFLTIKRFGSLNDRMRDFQSAYEIFSDIPRFKNIVLKSLNPGVPYIWGPRVPGLKEVFATRGLAVACAWQWDCCVRWIEADGNQLEPDRFLTIKYEDLLKEPDNTIRKIYTHIGMNVSETVMNELNKLEPKNRQYDVKLDQSDYDEIYALMRNTLKLYGYN
jgi:hypothetical protein